MLPVTDVTRKVAMSFDEELVEPGYQPEYTGDAGLGDVGSGREFGANLYALYRAGRNELPGVASTYARLVNSIHPVRCSMEVQFDRPNLGKEQVHVRLLELREEAHDIFRQNCLRMREVGQALVETADGYAATDQAATDEFARMLEANTGEFENHSPYVPETPTPNDENQHPPYYQG
jgi:hypothetical protein